MGQPTQHSCLSLVPLLLSTVFFVKDLCFFSNAATLMVHIVRQRRRTMEERENFEFFEQVAMLKEEDGW